MNLFIFGSSYACLNSNNILLIVMLTLSRNKTTVSLVHTLENNLINQSVSFHNSTNIFITGEE